MNNNIRISYNGKIQEDNSCQINVLDRGFLFGDSIYEATFCYQNKPLYLKEHLARLSASAELIQMNIQEVVAKLTQWIEDILDYSGFEHSILRIVVTRGLCELDLLPKNDPVCNVIIFCKKFKPYPKSWYENGVQFIIPQTKRNHMKSLNPQAKTGNYMNNILALQEAKKAGAHDSIMCNLEGDLTEGTTNNIWIIKNNIIKTPHLESGLLNGITRQKVLELCSNNSIKVQECRLRQEDAYHSDEMFYTSSTKGIVPITQIDDIKINDGNVGPLTKKLMNLYQELINNYLFN
jgi:branched-chain amino acid aminotransferase